MLNSFMQFSYDIELIGHTETYRSGFNEGYHANKDPFGTELQYPILGVSVADDD
jgi:hypothetical protein